MKTVAIIQARMGSSRLPGKVLRQLAGRPMLDHVYERTTAIPGVDEVIVATSMNAVDDAIAEWGKSASCHVFRGSEEDVLGRYLEAMKKQGGDIVMRITADCPLLDPEVCGVVLHEFKTSEPAADYAVTVGYPRGLDTEVFNMQALLAANQGATDPAEREHVTLHLYRRPRIFRLLEVGHGEADRSDWRWTVDTFSDFLFVESVLDRLPPGDFCWKSIREILTKETHLSEINRHVPQKSPF